MTDVAGKYRFRQACREYAARSFRQCSLMHREWAQRLADAVKERGLAPPSRFMVEGYYDDPNDKIVAMFAALPMKDGNVPVRMAELHDIIGERPYRCFFLNRAFVHLSCGGGANRTMGGTMAWCVAGVLDALYAAWVGRGADPCEQMLSERTEPVEWVRKLSKGFVARGDDAEGTLVWWLARRGLWKLPERLVPRPETGDFTRFLKTFFPGHRGLFSYQEMADLYGLADRMDVYHASVGYGLLRARWPERCDAYERAYRQHFQRGLCVAWRRLRPLRKALPPIDLDLDGE